MHPRRARTRMDSAKECLEEVGRGRDAGPPAGCGQAQPTLGTSESDRGVYLVILLVYLQQKKEEGLHQFSTNSVPLTSCQEDPRLGTLNIGACALAVIFLSRSVFCSARAAPKCSPTRRSLHNTEVSAAGGRERRRTPHTRPHVLEAPAN